jgi:DNA invertase Pin-like site-specific DNA recombinase
MFIGYARTSTVDQNYSLEDQLEKLEAADCDRIYSEQVSAVESSRPEFEKALEVLREGDVLVVTKLDRLARSVLDLNKTMQTIEAKGAGLKILDLALDTTTATGRMMMNVIGSVGQFERELMLERQRIGIQKAKDAGRYKGRPPQQDLHSEIKRMHSEGMKPSKIAEALGIGVATVYRNRT